MVSSLVNFIGKAFQPPQVTSVSTTSTTSTNPFGNPFVQNSQNPKYDYYGKNKPVTGGYFAGYYNGKPNLVGQRLFIEV